MIPAVLVAVSLFSCSWGRARVWANAKQVAASLDDVAQVQVPEGLRFDPEFTKRDGEFASFTFKRVNDHHLNGQTSYAEFLQITLLPPDLPAPAIEAQRQRGSFDPSASRGEAIRSEQEGTARWDFLQFTYDRDPVHEPALLVRLTDPASGYAISWWGYRKQYTFEQAQTNLRFVRSTLRFTGDRKAFFQANREYDGDRWQAAYDRNLRVLAECLSDLNLSRVVEPGIWAHHDALHYVIDRARPQRFYVVRFTGQMAKPETPVAFEVPTTALRFIQNHWVQDNQGTESALLPPAHLEGLLAKYKDPSQVYLFRIHAMNLWKDQPDMANQLRAWTSEAKPVQ